MASKSVTSRDFFRTLNILFLALLGGQVIFAGISLFIVLEQEMPMDSMGELKTPLLIAVPFLLVSGLFGSNFLYRGQLAVLNKLPGMESKLMTYSRAFIIKMALLEAPSLFAIVSFILTANFIFIGVAGVMIAYFALQKPTPEKIAQDLQLNSQETTKLYNPDAIVTTMTIQN